MTACRTSPAWQRTDLALGALSSPYKRHTSTGLCCRVLLEISFGVHPWRIGYIVHNSGVWIFWLIHCGDKPVLAFCPAKVPHDALRLLFADVPVGRFCRSRAN